MTHADRPSAAATALPLDLDEAAHRCLVAGFDGTTTVPHTLKRLIDRGLGGVILFTRNVRDAEQVRRLTDELRALRPDLLVAIDNEGGDTGHLVNAGAPEAPGCYALGVADDPALTARCADALAGHLATLGITASYAPVADLQHQPRNPIVRTRSFGAPTPSWPAAICAPGSPPPTPAASPPAPSTSPATAAPSPTATTASRSTRGPTTDSSSISPRSAPPSTRAYRC